MRRTVLFAAFSAAIVAPAAHSQSATFPDQLAATIDCNQWSQNQDGSWDTGPNATLPGMRFSNVKRITLSNIFFNGVNVAEMLEKKCGQSRVNSQNIQ